MASGYRNGVHKGTSVKVDRPVSAPPSSLRPSSSFKSHRPPPPVRRSSPSSLGGASAKYDDSGLRRVDSPAQLYASIVTALILERDLETFSGRVRVAVRLRPRNDEELEADADFADCVELQPELKRLKLRKNNWDSDTYEFDEVLTEFASQKRVYEVVAKPVVESVLDGYNGTVMAYGQTGTGKTHTLGRLGDEDTSARGIMVRAMEDIIADITPETDSISVSYLQIYMETIQDLLNPANNNIAIVEDPKTGDVSLPGASLAEIRDQQSFMELLRLGEAHRFAANTKMNTESSRSHAILMVHVKKSVLGAEAAFSYENDNPYQSVNNFKPPVIRTGKLFLVDLAGSERIHKSGSEGHTLEEAKSINLSLSALGKCINALAENSAHVPVRDSKLTRLLRDSFGGTARTSLIVTIGPSPRHRAETASTILFGQRAMKVENMLKIKEEFDYKSLSRRLDIQLDKLIAENERQQKAFEDEIERINLEAQSRISEAERKFADALERERVNCQMDYMESIKKLEEKWVLNQEKHGKNGFTNGSYSGEVARLEPSVIRYASFLKQLLMPQLYMTYVLNIFFGKRQSEKYGSSSISILNLGLPSTCNVTLSLCLVHVGAVNEESEVKMLLQNEINLRKAAEEEINILRNQLSDSMPSEAGGDVDVKLQRLLDDEVHQKKRLEEEVMVLRSQLSQLTFEADQNWRLARGKSGNSFTGVDPPSHPRHSPVKDAVNGHMASITNLHEQVGLQKIFSLLESDDPNVRIHAVKVVANLAAEEANQQRIVEAGGLTSLLMLLRSLEDETVRRVAAGAIANLAMNEANQEFIMAEGGIKLLAMTAADAEDPQTLRMVAGAIANLCGNDKLQMRLRSEGGIKALLQMVRCRHPDVLSQVARGIANFAKCESRVSTHGTKNGRSILIEDGALPWIVQNSNNEASLIRRHTELALCHLAQHEVNAKDMISGGALWELVRISRDCSREDIKALARRTMTSSPTFYAELRRLRIDL
ncbi:hypothetical protein RHSIM_Rhsim07G0026100 [Rhododendron simsii]|uniref:Kinesin-like protein n=1 Tax=Rhododendron simsii TaxID=118357 RepID=A0A834GWB7_RHOSS|nr:hypothetical protein RHSIM_Rhsim07G0026100 [Rhododendron simsii]